LADIRCNIAVIFCYKPRKRIVIKQQNRSEHFCGRIELGEGRGKHGRITTGTIAVFGLLKRVEIGKIM